MQGSLIPCVLCKPSCSETLDEVLLVFLVPLHQVQRVVKHSNVVLFQNNNNTIRHLHPRDQRYFLQTQERGDSEPWYELETKGHTYLVDPRYNHLFEVPMEKK